MKYRVIGSRRVMDTAPGDVFEADLPPEQEGSLIAAGHIEPVSKPPKKSADGGEPKEQ